MKCLNKTREIREKEAKKEIKYKYNKQKILRNMVGVYLTVSIIILNVNGLSIPLKDRDC